MASSSRSRPTSRNCANDVGFILTDSCFYDGKQLTIASYVYGLKRYAGLRRTLSSASSVRAVLAPITTTTANVVGSVLGQGPSAIAVIPVR